MLLLQRMDTERILGWMVTEIRIDHAVHFPDFLNLAAQLAFPLPLCLSCSLPMHLLMIAHLIAGTLGGLHGFGVLLLPALASLRGGKAACSPIAAST